MCHVEVVGWELACTDSLDLVLLSTAALVTAGVLPAELAITPTELIHPEVAELMPMVSCIVCVASCVLHRVCSSFGQFVWCVPVQTENEFVLMFLGVVFFSIMVARTLKKCGCTVAAGL